VGDRFDNIEAWPTRLAARVLHQAVIDLTSTARSKGQRKATLLWLRGENCEWWCSIANISHERFIAAATAHVLDRDLHRIDRDDVNDADSGAE